MLLFRQPGFLSAEECLVVRRAMDGGTVETAEVLSRGVRVRPRVRNASLIEPDSEVIRQIEDRLETCRSPVESCLHLDLGEREGPGFIRYPDGGYYRPHVDRGADPQWPAAARRAASMVVFLNSAGHGAEFGGGSLVLFPTNEAIEVIPEAGLLVAFPSDVLHEVTPVRGGTRDTIVDWFYVDRRATG